MATDLRLFWDADPSSSQGSMVWFNPSGSDCGTEFQQNAFKIGTSVKKIKAKRSLGKGASMLKSQSKCNFSVTIGGTLFSFTVSI